MIFCKINHVVNGVYIRVALILIMLLFATGCNSGGGGPQGPPTSAPQVAPTLSSPSNDGDISDPTPMFKWGSVSDAQEYQIQVDIYSDFSNPDIDTKTTGTSYTPSSRLWANQYPYTYYWRVRASNEIGKGPWSGYWRFTVDPLVVVIDPGHGGKDPGTQGTYNGQTILEKDLNLEMAKKVKSQLDNDFAVYLTHTGDITDTLKPKDRCKFAGEKKADFLVSIHNNSASKPADRTELFYWRESKKDKSNAQNMQKAISEYLSTEGPITRTIEVKPDNEAGPNAPYGKLRLLECASKEKSIKSVLVEIAFMNNPDDLKLLMDNKDLFAQAIAAGIRDVLKAYQQASHFARSASGAPSAIDAETVADTETPTQQAEDGENLRPSSVSAPRPDVTWQLTATVPSQVPALEQGELLSSQDPAANPERSLIIGEAYVYKSASTGPIDRPVIVTDDFDPGDRRGVDELYELLNQAHFIEDGKAAGLDFVLLNLDEGAGDIKANASLLVELIKDEDGAKWGGHELVVIGPGMGGLIARYALADMEKNNVPHNVRLFISLDAPHQGANFPLGNQHWINFFATRVDPPGDEPLPKELTHALSDINSVAARQTFVYHHSCTHDSQACPDQYWRKNLEMALESVGQYPNHLRKVAIANGSGTGQRQLFDPGDSLVSWKHESWPVDITGNTWAVPTGTSKTKIFEGLFDTPITLEQEENRYVQDTLPFDTAPGGRYNSTGQIADANTGGYGNIRPDANDPDPNYAARREHCFVPTISALDISAPHIGLDSDIAAQADSIYLWTPFDKIYYPTENQIHGQITAQNKEWMLHEICAQPQVTIHAPSEDYQNAGYAFTLAGTASGGCKVTRVKVVVTGSDTAGWSGMAYVPVNSAGDWSIPLNFAHWPARVLESGKYIKIEVTADLLGGSHVATRYVALPPNVISDFDGNGKSDLGFLEPSDNTFHVNLSTGTDFFGAGSGQWVTPGAFGHAAGRYYIGDFNGDGRSDLGFFEPSDNTFHVNLSTGTGFFGAESGQWVTPGTFGHAAGRYYIGDFNGDVKSDLAFFEPSDNTFHVNLSTGTGFFGAGSGQWVTPGAFGHAAGRYYIGDFNGDVKSDLAFFEPSDNTFHVNLSTGTGFFGAGSGRWLHPGAFVHSAGRIYVGDFDRDRRSDLGFFEPADSSFHVTLSTGNGFSAPGSGQWVAPGAFGHYGGRHFVGNSKFDREFGYPIFDECISWKDDPRRWGWHPSDPSGPNTFEQFAITRASDPGNVYLGGYAAKLRIPANGGRASGAWHAPLPDSTGAKYFVFAYKKTNPASTPLVYFVANGYLHQAWEAGQTVHHQGWEIPFAADTEWHLVVLPLDVAHKLPSTIIDPNTSQLEPMVSSEGQLTFFELGMGGVGRDAIYFDHIHFSESPITLADDPYPPRATINVPGEDYQNTGYAFSLEGTAIDPGSGIASVRVGATGSGGPGSLGTFSAEVDAAGNWSLSLDFTDQPDSAFILRKQVKIDVTATDLVGNSYTATRYVSLPPVVYDEESPATFINPHGWDCPPPGGSYSLDLFSGQRSRRERYTGAYSLKVTIPPKNAACGHASAWWDGPLPNTTGTTHFTFAYKKTNPDSRMAVYFILSDAIHEVSEVDPVIGAVRAYQGWDIPYYRDTEWHVVAVPYASEQPVPGADKVVGSVTGQLASFEAGLGGGKAGDAIYFDLIEFQRTPWVSSPVAFRNWRFVDPGGDPNADVVVSDISGHGYGGAIYLNNHGSGNALAWTTEPLATKDIHPVDITPRTVIQWTQKDSSHSLALDLNLIRYQEFETIKYAANAPNHWTIPGQYVNQFGVRGWVNMSPRPTPVYGQEEMFVRNLYRDIQDTLGPDEEYDEVVSIALHHFNNADAAEGNQGGYFEDLRIFNAAPLIFVNNDEWTLSDQGFAQSPDTAQFARNLATWFAGGRPGSFLVYSTPFGFNTGLVGSELANTMTNAGHTWTVVSTTTTFSLADLLQYDGIFLAGSQADDFDDPPPVVPPDTQVLIDYVKAGGNVYLASGTDPDNPASEAAQWNPFLHACGLDFVPTLNDVDGILKSNSSHPIFASVQRLLQRDGNSIRKLDPSDPNAAILVQSQQGEGLYAVCSIGAPVEGAPTAIDLLSFTAQAAASHVTLAWETGTEVDNAGFNLHRATAADGPYTKLNDAPIPAEGDPESGASYTYTDAGVVKGVTYYYKLEDVDIHGASTFHGPVSATPSPIHRIYLPLLLK
jgi:N-acetylmuramoyl-L-alanine amidase